MAIVPFSINANYKGFAQFGETYNGTTQQEWDRLHDGNGNANGSDIKAGWGEGDSWQRTMQRGFLAFDTSNILDDAVITDAYIKITGTEYYKNAARDFVIGSGTQNSSIANSDYEDHVTTTNYGTWTGSGDSGSGANSITAEQIDFNATGRAAISKTGITKLSWRYAYDQSDTIAISADSYNYVILTDATLYVTYQVDETKTLIDAINISSSIVRLVNKLMSEGISISSWIVGYGTNFIKTITETIVISSSCLARILQNYVKTFTESISLSALFNVLRNGRNVDYWTKIVKIATSWTKIKKTDVDKEGFLDG